MLHSSSSYSSPSIPISTTSLGLLVASVGLPFVRAATTDDYYSKINPTAALPGFNVEGGSAFENIAMASDEGQLFFIATGSGLNERPETDPVRASSFSWCSDLTFSDVRNSSLIGYAGRCVARILAGYEAMEAAGGQLSFAYSKGEFSATLGISAVFVEQLNVFEGQYHSDTDDDIWRYWDDGRKTSPIIVWEGHDEGDMNPNAATSSWSGFGEMNWVSVDEVAQLFNTSVDEFTPETFKQVYLDTWIKDHEYEAAIDNPNPLPELEIVEQVKNETSVDETTTPAQPDSTVMEDDGSDGADPVVIDDSGSGRKLASVAARFVSAALRVFGF